MRSMKINWQLFLFIIIALSLISPATVLAWSLEDATVRVRAPDTETGSGVVIGHTGNSVYLITAKHVVSGYVGSHVTTFFKQSPGLSFEAEVLNRDDKIGNVELDIVILKIDLLSDKNSENAPFLSLDNFIGTKIGRLNLLDCDIGENVYSIGYSSGTFNYHKIYSKIQSTRFDNEREFFTIGSSSIEGGVSGSPLFNSSDEMLGIVVEVSSDNKTAKVVSVSSMLSFIEDDSVPKNKLRSPSLLGRWKLSGVDLSKRGRVVPDQDWELMIGDSGKLSGMVSGKFCLKNLNKLEFVIRGIPTSISVPVGNGVTTSISINNGDVCDINIAHGFDFTNKSKPVRTPLYMGVQSTQGDFMSVLCESQYGNVEYTFSKGI